MAVSIHSTAEQADTVRKLRILERWFAENHCPYAFVSPDGTVRSRVVCLALPDDEPHKALAFRGLCRELGIGESLVQWTVRSGSGTAC